MAIPALLAPVLVLVTKASFIKYVAVMAIIGLMAAIVPMVIDLLGVGRLTGLLDASLGNLAPSVWYFIDLFQFSYGLPVLITAYVSRFLIRRIPVIG